MSEANVQSAFCMHFGHSTSANPQGDAVFGRAGRSAQTCRVLIRDAVCSRYFAAGLTRILILLWDSTTGALGESCMYHGILQQEPAKILNLPLIKAAPSGVGQG